MFSVLILSQGNLAHELLAAARAIVGELPRFEAVGLGWDDDFESAREATARALDRLGPEGGVLILTDTFGATPYNVAMTFHRPGEVEVLTGVNLPMVMRLGCAEKETRPLAEVAAWIERKGRKSIRRAEAARDAVGEGMGERR